MKINNLTRNIFLYLLAILILTSAVSAATSQYNVIFTIDEKANTHVEFEWILQTKWQECVSDPYWGDDWQTCTTYSLPEATWPIYIPEYIKDFEYNDDFSITRPKYFNSTEGWIKYTKDIPEINSGEKKTVRWSYDLNELTTLRYKENYYFEHYLPDSDYDIYVCIPGHANLTITKYDSNNGDQALLNSNNELVNDTFTKNIQYSSHCSQGYKLADIDIVEGTVYSRFSIPGQTTKFTTYNSEKFEVYFPKRYDDIIESNMPMIEESLPAIKTIFNTSLKDKYLISFVDTYDLALNGSSFLVQDSGILATLNLFLNEDEFFQINIIKSIIGDFSNLDTDSDIWWLESMEAFLAREVMIQSNLEHSTIDDSLNISQAYLDNAAGTFKLQEKINNNEIGIFDGSTLVLELNDYCPNYVNTILKKYEDNVFEFYTNKNFNNFLLYSILDDCTRDPYLFFDKYRILHDDVKTFKKSYDVINNDLNKKIIEDITISEINKLKHNLKQADIAFNKGDFLEVQKIMFESEHLYESPEVQSTIKVMKLIEDIKNSDNIVKEIFPVNMLIDTNLDSVIDYINSNKFSLAEENTKDALFWSNNGLVAVIVFYILIGLLIIFGFKIWKKKRNKKHKHKKENVHQKKKK